MKKSAKFCLLALGLGLAAWAGLPPRAEAITCSSICGLAHDSCLRFGNPASYCLDRWVSCLDGCPS